MNIMYHFNLRRHRRLFLSALGINLLILSSCLHSKEDEEKPSTAAADNANKVLMITGGKAHDYDTLPRKLAEVLAKTGKMNIHVASNLSALTSDNIKTCDVLMFNTCEDTNLDETQRLLILEALRQGKGLVAMHCALYSFQGWPEWRKIVGAVVNKHDPYTTFDVAVVDSQSSITTDVPRQFSISDEPYLAEEWIEDNHVLVHTVKPHGKINKPEPMAWPTRYAGGHVFSHMFGHDVKA